MAVLTIPFYSVIFVSAGDIYYSKSKQVMPAHLVIIRSSMLIQIPKFLKIFF